MCLLKLLRFCERFARVPSSHPLKLRKEGICSKPETARAFCQLAEIKSLSAGAAWYKSNQKTVDVRTKSLPKEYHDKAHKIDMKYCGTGQTQVGPLEQCLNGFGDLVFLVAGQYGEVSQDFHKLLAKLISSKIASAAVPLSPLSVLRAPASLADLATFLQAPKTQPSDVQFPNKKKISLPKTAEPIISPTFEYAAFMKMWKLFGFNRQFQI